MKKRIEKVLIEISKGSSVKYEVDKERNEIVVDRFLYGTNVYPGNYGAIEKTLEFDGDPIDVIVCVSQPTIPGCYMNVKVIGGIDMIDDDQRDLKIIGVFVGDPIYNHINDLEELPKIEREKIVDFFQNYKNLERKKCKIRGSLTKEEVIRMIDAAKERFQEFQKLSGSLTKEEFLKTQKETV